MAGDFNEEPQNQPISEVMNSSFCDLYQMMQIQKREKDVFTYSELHPALTTFKYREKEGWVKRTIDYIFMARNDYYNTNKCTISECLDPSDVEKEGLLNMDIGNPCPNHPSDHYSIGYQVRLHHPDPFLQGDAMAWETSGSEETDEGTKIMSTKLEILPNMTFSLVNLQ